MNARVPCRLQHVEAERHVLRAQHTQLRHALHRPGNLKLPLLRYACDIRGGARAYADYSRIRNASRYTALLRARIATSRFPLRNISRNWRSRR